MEKKSTKAIGAVAATEALEELLIQRREVMAHDVEIEIYIVEYVILIYMLCIMTGVVLPIL